MNLKFLTAHISLFLKKMKISKKEFENLADLASLSFTSDNTELSKEDILKQLKKNTISCKEVTFSIFGVSLASINTIFSFVLFCIFFNMFKKYENNK